MERWFLFIASKAIFGVGAKDSVIFFIGSSGNQDWLSKTLQDIKPSLINEKIRVIELK